MPISLRKGTSKLLKPPRRLSRDPCSPLPPLGPYGLSKGYPWESWLPAFLPSPMLPPPPKSTMPSSSTSFLPSLAGSSPPSPAPMQTEHHSPRRKSPLPCLSSHPSLPQAPTPSPTLFGNPFTVLLQISIPPSLGPYFSLATIPPQ